MDATRRPPTPADAWAVLQAIRRIVRAVSLHSRGLSRRAGLNVPQLLALEVIRSAPGGSTTATHIARTIGVSPGTMSGIVDRLVGEGLVARERSADDRRRVDLRLTPAGEARLAEAPQLLQDRLLVRLTALEPDERARILEVLEQVVGLLEAEGLDASPILASGGLLGDGPPER